LRDTSKIITDLEKMLAFVRKEEEELKQQLTSKLEASRLEAKRRSNSMAPIRRERTKSEAHTKSRVVDDLTKKLATPRKAEEESCQRLSSEFRSSGLEVKRLTGLVASQLSDFELARSYLYEKRKVGVGLEKQLAKSKEDWAG
jgi:hypothetical protein